jgi:hypothetical protein
VAGDGQLFVVTDGVRHYGGMAMLGGGAATATVRALDPRSGQDRFARSHPFSMRGPYRIQAGNLLGTVYDGEGARGGAFGSSVAEDAVLGVVAIRGR